jgi:hypothetical protein
LGQREVCSQHENYFRDFYKLGRDDLGELFVFVNLFDRFISRTKFVPF